MSIADTETVQRCLDGDTAAFEALYTGHARRIRAYFRRSGFPATDADDLTQDTFMQACRSLGTFDPARGAFGTWLSAIARNTARKRFNRRDDARNFDPQLAEATLAGGDNPGAAAGAAEETRAVADCVEALGDDLARLVRLRYVEARTTRGIAEATGIPEATVRARLREALGALERCLKGKGVIE